MCNIALKCGDALSAYATSINDFDLKEKVTFTLSDLDKLKKTEVTNICQVIHDEANTHIAAAGTYGYVAADVTGLQTAIDLYHTDWQNPRQALIARNNAKATINEIVREVITVLFKNQMDKMVNTLKGTNPTFVEQYYLSREIIDLGSTTAKARGTVKNEINIPLANVLFTVYKAGTTIIEKQVVTDAQGKYTTSHITPGDYDFRWELEGYKVKTEMNVHIAAGKEVRRYIVLEKGDDILATYTAPLMASMLLNIGPWVNGTAAVRFTVTSGKARCSRSLDGTVVDGVPIVLMAPGTATKAAEDFQINGMHVVVENLSDSEMAHVKVELLG